MYADTHTCTRIHTHTYTRIYIYIYVCVWGGVWSVGCGVWGVGCGVWVWVWVGGWVGVGVIIKCNSTIFLGNVYDFLTRLVLIVLKKSESL
jgi:hypothetical protein